VSCVIACAARPASVACTRFLQPMTHDLRVKARTSARTIGRLALINGTEGQACMLIEATQCALKVRSARELAVLLRRPHHSCIARRRAEAGKYTSSRCTENCELSPAEVLACLEPLCPARSVMRSVADANGSRERIPYSSPAYRIKRTWRRGCRVTAYYVFFFRRAPRAQTGGPKR